MVETWGRWEVYQLKSRVAPGKGAGKGMMVGQPSAPTLQTSPKSSGAWDLQIQGPTLASLGDSEDIDYLGAPKG